MASVTNALFQSLAWKLTSMDDATVLEGHFAPSNMRHEVSANYSTVSTLGRSQPILQWDADTLEKITFDATIRANHQGLLGLGLVQADDITDLVEAIKALPRKTDLGRPHVWVLTSGDAIAFQCVVKSVGGIVYDRLRPLDGSYRSVTFRIELWRYVEYDVELTGSVAESLVRPFLNNESFESIGVRLYGDPRTGEPLRRRNPKLVVPSAGDVVHLPPKNLLMRRFVLKPQTDVLGYKDDDDAKAVLNSALARHKTGRSHVLGSAWDGK